MFRRARSAKILKSFRISRQHFTHDLYDRSSIPRTPCSVHT